MTAEIEKAGEEMVELDEIADKFEKPIPCGKFSDWLRSLLARLGTEYGIDLYYMRFSAKDKDPFHIHVYYPYKLCVNTESMTINFQYYGEFETGPEDRFGVDEPARQKAEEQLRAIFEKIKDAFRIIPRPFSSAASPGCSGNYR